MSESGGAIHPWKLKAHKDLSGPHHAGDSDRLLSGSTFHRFVTVEPKSVPNHLQIVFVFLHYEDQLANTLFQLSFLPESQCLISRDNDRDICMEALFSKRAFREFNLDRIRISIGVP